MDFTKIEPYYLYQTYNYNIPKIDLNRYSKKILLNGHWSFKKNKKLLFTINN